MRLAMKLEGESLDHPHNLATENPPKAKELHDQMLVWRTSIGAKMPEKNTPSAPSEAPKKKGKGKGRKKAQE